MNSSTRYGATIGEPPTQILKLFLSSVPFLSTRRLRACSPRKVPCDPCSDKKEYIGSCFGVPSFFRTAAGLRFFHTSLSFPVAHSCAHFGCLSNNSMRFSISLSVLMCVRLIRKCTLCQTKCSQQFIDCPVAETNFFQSSLAPRKCAELRRTIHREFFAKSCAKFGGQLSRSDVRVAMEIQVFKIVIFC